jgi:phosphoribosylaminoimidazolecarboxamide formyltransferase / IMP cyclohydrolase
VASSFLGNSEEDRLMPRALISVSDKTGIVEFARRLVNHGFDVMSTGGTARTLAAWVPIIAVSDYTGFPEMMDGRVKTLHPKIFGGILARRNNPADMEEIAEHGIRLIDIVVVNLYPFARAAANPNLPVDELVEQIDIGGPSLVRAAAKNFRDVLVVVDPGDYAQIIQEFEATGNWSLKFRLEMMQKAFDHTAMYDRVIAATVHRQFEVKDGEVVRNPDPPGN